jgi:enhancing lycopene biosynthesis protein 2
MAKVGVVLSGCGVYDGAEIHESVLTLLALDGAGAEIIFMAPDVEQMHVIDHLAGSPSESERRNVRVESARIARGEVKDIAEIKAADLDALIFPGGFGAAKNLCDFAVKGADCSVNVDVSRLVMEMHRAGKPVGFVCIAPAMGARIYGQAGVKGVKLTIGTDEETASALKTMGADHVRCDVRDCVVDEAHKVVSTPAYMLAGRITEASAGIGKLVSKVLELSTRS